MSQADDDESDCLSCACGAQHEATHGRAEIASLKAALTESRRECEEQARLNGMGASREAGLMAENATLRQEVERLKERITTLDAQWDEAVSRYEGVGLKLAAMTDKYHDEIERRGREARAADAAMAENEALRRQVEEQAAKLARPSPSEEALKMAQKYVMDAHYHRADAGEECEATCPERLPEDALHRALSSSAPVSEAKPTATPEPAKPDGERTFYIEPSGGTHRLVDDKPCHEGYCVHPSHAKRVECAAPQGERP